MRPFTLIVGLWLCSTVMSLAISKQALIILDPGHGGADPGAVHGGVTEKSLNLEITSRVGRILLAHGYRIALTRNSDKSLSLSERVRRTNRYPNAIYVSIHCNSAKRRAAHGIETFYAGKNSYRLAKAVHSKVIRATRANNKGLKNRRFFVLRNTTVPAILVECGFMTNTRELSLLRNAEYQQRIALAIASGIIRY